MIASAGANIFRGVLRVPPSFTPKPRVSSRNYPRATTALAGVQRRGILDALRRPKWGRNSTKCFGTSIKLRSPSARPPPPPLPATPPLATSFFASIMDFPSLCPRNFLGNKCAAYLNRPPVLPPDVSLSAGRRRVSVRVIKARTVNRVITNAITRY